MIIQHNTTLTALENFESSEHKDEFKNSFYVSNLGLECPKRQWLTFLNAYEDKKVNRIYRIFERGKREEEFLVKLLREIGIEVIAPKKDRDEDFLVVHLNGLIKGYLDAIALSGVPEATEKKHVVEFKTMKESVFNDVKKNGLEKAQPTHFMQLQTYMYKSDIDRGLYIAVNKNTDEIYIERVKLAKTLVKQALSRAEGIILNKHIMPPAISENKSFFKCKMCPASKVCHGDKIPEINCRTCVFSKAKEDGQFYCNYWFKKSGATNSIPLDFQKKGCPSHMFIPSLLRKLGTEAKSTETNLDQNLGNPNDFYFRWSFDTHVITISPLSGYNGYKSEHLLKLGYDGLLNPEIGMIKDAFQSATPV
jgi:hypothetical protein